MVLARVRHARRLRGTVHLPGDKSISHRALILNAVAGGTARVTHLSGGADVESTAACLRALGVGIEDGRVHGVGLRGLRAAAGPLDCGNSGTTMRLLAGLLAPQPFATVLVGDESLSRRPMGRVARPLTQMGGRVEAGPPLQVGGTWTPQRTHFDFTHEAPSAQVKSAILLAGLWGEETQVLEAVKTRDHTERMLAAMGAPIEVDGLRVTVRRADVLRPVDIAVPADLSAAAFWLVAGSAHPDAALLLPGVGVNPTRTALLDVLAATGLAVARGQAAELTGEPVADLEVGSALEARPLEIGGDRAAELIDELPVLAVAAATIPGRSVICGAGELRVKESDRIAAMTEGLRAMGADIEELEDGWVIRGGRPLEGARVPSRGDHRVAMALAIAGLLAAGDTEIEDAECVAISYPGFWDDVERVCR
jgi:3-phosphoshikimate 1-carboxyvinyltransferase